jgi:hypothetical protein
MNKGEGMAWAILRAATLPLVSMIVLLVVISYLPDDEVYFLMLEIIILFFWVIAMVGNMVAASWGRAWNKTLIIAIALIGVWPFMWVSWISRDYVHLALMYPFYASRITAADAHPSKPIRFGWGMQHSGSIALVYDPTGKTLPGDGQDPIEPAISTQTRHLIGNFYIEDNAW